MDPLLDPLFLFVDLTKMSPPFSKILDPPPTLTRGGDGGAIDLGDGEEGKGEDGGGGAGAEGGDRRGGGGKAKGDQS